MQQICRGDPGDMEMTIARIMSIRKLLYTYSRRHWPTNGHSFQTILFLHHIFFLYWTTKKKKNVWCVFFLSLFVCIFFACWITLFLITFHKNNYDHKWCLPIGCCTHTQHIRCLYIISFCLNICCAYNVCTHTTPAHIIPFIVISSLVSCWFHSIKCLQK